MHAYEEELERLAQRICRPFGLVRIHLRDGAEQTRDWSSWSLREAQEADVPDVTAWIASIPAVHLGIPDGARVAEEVAMWMRLPRLALVRVNPRICVDGRTSPTAFISVEPLRGGDNPIWEIGRLVVAPFARKQGIGEALVRRLFTAAREALGTNVQIVGRVVSTNATSARMCARAGLRQISPPEGLPTDFIWFSDQ